MMAYWDSLAVVDLALSAGIIITRNEKESEEANFNGLSNNCSTPWKRRPKIDIRRPISATETTYICTPRFGPT